MHEAGEGVAKDDAQVEFWYRKAAEQGSAQAQGALGKRRQRSSTAGPDPSAEVKR